MQSARRKVESALRTVVTLTLIAMVASGLLAWAYQTTKEPISRAKEAQKSAAISSVLPGFANRPLAEAGRIGETVVYPAKDAQGKLIGAAVEAISDRGFGGDIRLLVGVDLLCRVTDYSVLEHRETPGLGDKIERTRFRRQFHGKSLKSFRFKVVKDGGDVDAVTAATITSRAATEAVRSALESYELFMGERCAQ